MRCKIFSGNVRISATGSGFQFVIQALMESPDEEVFQYSHKGLPPAGLRIFDIALDRDDSSDLLGFGLMSTLANNPTAAFLITLIHRPFSWYPF